MRRHQAHRHGSGQERHDALWVLLRRVSGICRRRWITSSTRTLQPSVPRNAPLYADSALLCQLHILWSCEHVKKVGLAFSRCKEKLSLRISIVYIPLPFPLRYLPLRYPPGCNDCVTSCANHMGGKGGSESVFHLRISTLAVEKRLQWKKSPSSLCHVCLISASFYSCSSPPFSNPFPPPIPLPQILLA